VDRRLFLWGLANGATVLALAGAFWIGLGVGMVATRVHWGVSALGTVVQLSGVVWLIRAAARLRRRSGFQRSELRRLEGIAEAQRQHIVKCMAWTTLGQTVFIGLLVWSCVRVQAEQLIWASIGVVVSLHFLPLGRLFHVRVYYATGIAGALVSSAGFAASGTPIGVASLGLCMATVMWVSAAHILSNADRIADRSCAEPWAV
jgi:hypothetical protein